MLVMPQILQVSESNACLKYICHLTEMLLFVAVLYGVTLRFPSQTVTKLVHSYLMKCDEITVKSDIATGWVGLYVLNILQHPYCALLWTRMVRSGFDQYVYNFLFHSEDSVLNML